MFLDLNFNKIFARLYVENVTVICHGLPYKLKSVTEKYNALATHFAKRGLNTLIFDFTGTGKSKGEFRISNWIEDLKNIVKNFEKINLVGFSMGGVVSTYIAANSDRIMSLVLVSTPCCANIFENKILERIYLNAKEKGVLMGIGSYEDFVNKFKKDIERFEPIKWIDQVNAPVLIVHGTSDEIVNYKSAEILFKKANEPKKLMRIENGSHFLRHDKNVIEKIIDWIINVEKVS